MLLTKFRITGHSMQPKLKENDLVLVSKIFYIFKSPSINDIVAFERSGKILVKRIIKISGNNYFISGDNKKDSFDSKAFGPIKKESIVGKVFYKLT